MDADADAVYAAPIQIHHSKLHLFPSPRGMQHCEVIARRAAYPDGWPKRLRLSWPVKDRKEVRGAVLHPSVMERFAAGEVAHAGQTCCYRPETLREDDRFSAYFPGQGPGRVEG